MNEGSSEEMRTVAITDIRFFLKTVKMKIQRKKKKSTLKLQGDPALSAMTSKFGYQEIESCGRIRHIHFPPIP